MKKNKLFDFAIGNPPYQDEENQQEESVNKRNYAPPVYHIFLEEAYKVSSKVELIHPARFLFNAGSTPKDWNEKMLNDEHLKVVYYEPDSNKVFPGLSTPLKGGVAVTYHDDTLAFNPVTVFTKYEAMNRIIQKIGKTTDKSLMDITYSRTSYRFTDEMHKAFPEAITKLSNGHAYDISSNIFTRLPEVFHVEAPNDGYKYAKILGRDDSGRVYRYIRRDFINDVDNFDYYKVFVPQANGTGVFGEPIGKTVIEGPGVGSTETFISIGRFKTKDEAVDVEKYIKTKFARALLSSLKVTQNGNRPVWKLIPLQNFTPQSDIDWSKSIHEIDLQLYRKYNFSDDEIEFIETHVKEMN